MTWKWGREEGNLKRSAKSNDVLKQMVTTSEKTRGFQAVASQNGMAVSAKRNGCAPNLRVLALNTSKEVSLQRGRKPSYFLRRNWHTLLKTPVLQSLSSEARVQIRVCLPQLDLSQLRCETGQFQNYLSKSTDASYRCGSSGPH